MDNEYSATLLRKSNRDLKELCKRNNLLISGNKKDMVRRLVTKKYDDSHKKPDADGSLSSHRPSKSCVDEAMSLDRRLPLEDIRDDHSAPVILASREVLQAHDGPWEVSLNSFDDLLGAHQNPTTSFTFVLVSSSLIASGGAVS